jgi:putative hydrolase of the HAD superfamily
VRAEVIVIRGPHRAVLFDLFDTLVDIDSEAYLQGKREEAHLLGVDPERFLAAWMEVSDRAQRGDLPDFTARLRHAARACGADPADVVLRRVALLEERMATITSLHPDVRPTLEGLRRDGRLLLGLVSNASSTAALLVQRLDLARHFDHLVFSFRVGVLKPDPVIYLTACRALGVRPEDCLFVGDGNGFELDGARALGMETVRIERDVRPGPFRKGESLTFDASVDDLTCVLDLVRPAA